MVEIKRLNVGGETYEIVDEAARNDVSTLKNDVKTLQAKDKEISERVDVMSDTFINRTANAITKEVSGEVVKADNVSPVEHEVDVWVHGKNLFVNKKERSGSTNGLTFVMPQNTSSVIFNGTASIENSIAFPDTITLKKGTYTASVIGSVGSDRIYLRNTKTNEVLINHITASAPRTFTLNETAEVLANFVFKQGSSYDNTTINVQIEQGSTATEYTPYVDPSTVKVTRYGSDELDNPVTYTPNSNGNVDGVMSLSPNMTIMTDTEDVIVECEYIQDTNKVIEKLTNAIVALGGTV